MCNILNWTFCHIFITMSSHFDTPTLKGSKLDIKICKIRFLGTVMYNISNWTFLPILIHYALARRCSDHERFKSAKSPLTVTRRRSYELKGKSKGLSRLFSLCRVQMKTFQLNTIVLIRQVLPSKWVIIGISTIIFKYLVEKQSTPKRITLEFIICIGKQSQTSYLGNKEQVDII